MPSDSFSDLLALADAHRVGRDELLERARAFGQSLGIEVLDVLPAASNGAWYVCLRSLPDSGSTSDGTDAASAGAAAPVPADRLDRPPPYRSPVCDSPPFEGDGTDDIGRLIAEADPSTRVPGRGGPVPGAAVRVLSAEERVRMLASTIAGDALLSLQHRGLAEDPSEVDGALVLAREQYLAEAGRCGVDAQPSELAADFDRVAADLCHTLLTGYC